MSTENKKMPCCSFIWCCFSSSSDNKNEDHNVQNGFSQLSPLTATCLKDSLLTEDQTDVDKRSLHDFYKNISLPTVPWLNQDISTLNEDYFNNIQIESTNNKPESTNLENLFIETECGTAKLILVEGELGFGKTSLAVKLTHDWAHGRSYLQEFDYLFLIPLRYLNGKNLQEAVSLISERCGFERPVDLDDSQKNVLLVLDGYDEINESRRSSLLQELNQDKYKALTVVLTSKPGVLLKGTVRRIFWKKVILNGVTEEDRQIFISKVFPNASASSILGYLSSIPENNELLFANPLLLLGLSRSFNEDRKLKTTMTKMFESLLNNLINFNLKLDGKFDLHDTSLGKSGAVQEILQKFGEKCLKQLASEHYSFNFDETIADVYDLGLLTKFENNFGFATVQSFKCYHLSFMEFFAAYSIYRKLEHAQIEDDVQKKSFQGLLELENSSMVYLFLSGLLQDNLTRFQECLRSENNGLDVNWVGQNFWKIFPELEKSDKLIQFLGQYFSDEMFQNLKHSTLKYESDFLRDVVREGIRSQTVKNISIPKHLFQNFPVGVIIPDLHVDLVQTDELQECLTLLNRIQCRRLNYNLNFQEVLEISPQNLGVFIECFHSIKAKEEKTLHVTDDKESFLKIEDLGQLKVSLLRIRMADDHSVDFVSALLEEDRVYHLDVYLQGSEVPQRMLDAMLQSSSLKKLSLNSAESVNINFHRFNEKEWQYVDLDNCKLYCQSLDNETPCCECKKAVDEMKMDNRYILYNCSFSSKNCSWVNRKPKINVLINA